MVYKITKVIEKLKVKLGFTSSCHIRIKEHSVFLTEVFFYLNRRSDGSTSSHCSDEFVELATGGVETGSVGSA